MEFIWNYGINFIVWFQGLGSWLITPMKFFSFLGSEEFFLLILPILYWCVDANLGLRMGIIILFSGGINEILKLSLHGPRPYWFSTLVKAYAAETSFGVPSGHAQIAASMWGMAAVMIKRPWASILAVFIILMIGLSRLYLGVHFPHDVLLGWAIGTLILWVFVKWWDAVSAWAKKKSLGQQVGLAFALSMLMLVFGLIAFGTLRNWVLPAEWLANAQQSGMDVMPAPNSLNTTITSAAIMFGMLAGLAWMNSRGGFDSSGTARQRILRLLPGLVGVLIFYLGLRAIFPSGEMFSAYFLRYVRYALIGLWITAGAPWFFQKLNLAQKKSI
ncbi:MAG: phosphatase PAP2 family protein [Chloroflexi bacterium]|nr:phosphatase PAP2 family protein [Chloroflexota bacterium]